MTNRSLIRLLASHAAVILAGLFVAGRLAEPHAPPAVAAIPAPVSKPQARVPRAPEPRAERSVSEWRSGEFLIAWEAVRTAKLATTERVSVQRELLAKWARVDLQAAIHAALEESWKADGPWYGKVMVIEECGPVLDALGESLAENPDASWSMIRSGEFGSAAGMLRRLWMIEVSKKDALYLANRIGDFSWRDRERAIQACGVAIMNPGGNLRNAKFMEILLKLPPDQVSAEQLYQWGATRMIRKDEAPLRKAELRETDPGDTRMLRFRGMLLGRTLFAKSPEEIGVEIADVPAVARGDVLFTALKMSRPESGRLTGLVDLLVAAESWDKLAAPEVLGKLQQVTASVEIEAIARWATGLPPREETRQLFDGSVEAYLRVDPEAAADWIKAIPEGAWRDRACVRYSEIALHHHNTPESSEWALGMIGDPGLKREAEATRRQWEEASGWKGE